MESLTLGRMKVKRNELLTGVGGSFMVHLLLVASAFIVTYAFPHQPVKPPYCSVNLVSLQDIGSGNSEPKGDPKAPEAAKVSDAPKSSARISEKSEPVAVKRLQLDEPSKREEAPIKKIERKEAPKIAETPQNLAAIEKDLDKLITKPKVVPRTSAAAESAAESPPKPATQEPAAGKPARTNPTVTESAGRGSPTGSPDAGAKGATQGSTSGSLEGSSAASALAGLYMDKVIKKIQPEWRIINDPSLTGLKVVITVHITKNGDVIKIDMIRPSGNALFDDAAKRAVQNAAPLPAVPEAIVQPSTKLTLTFLPEGIS